MTYFATGETG